MAQLIALIHTLAELKVRLGVILNITSISQINQYYNWRHFGKILKFSRQDKQTDQTTNIRYIVF